MSKATRKLKRNKMKSSKKSMNGQMLMFDKLPGNCTNCVKQYDRKDKEMAKKWTVVVRKKQKKVNLYCEQCWDEANEMMNEIKEDLNEHKKST